MTCHSNKFCCGAYAVPYFGFVWIELLLILGRAVKVCRPLFRSQQHAILEQKLDFPHRTLYSVFIVSMLSKRVKTKIVGEAQKHKTDTGSAEVQVSVLSRQIDELASHLKKHPKDNHSRKGLLGMVSRRRRLLTYMKRKEPKEYEKMMKKLDLKK